MQSKAHPDPERHSGKQKVTLLVLLLVVLGTVFLLPQIVSEPWITGETDRRALPPETAASAVSPSTAAEKTRYRQESQGVLAEIIAIRDRLIGLQVKLWAEIEFGQALARVEQGDEQYSFGEYAESLENYQKALTQLKSVEETGRQTLARALADGTGAIESLNTVVATASSELATAMAPERQDVQNLAARVAKLPQLTGLLEKADQDRTEGKLQAARDAYQKAVALDPAHQRAATALSSIKIEITDEAFRRHMSRGYTALENQQFAQAEQAFKQAGGIYPGRAAVSKALAQVENRKSQNHVSAEIRRAAELEAREEWQPAISIYTSLLAQDPSLTEAKVKMIPARVRANLDDRLERTTADPLKLSQSTVYGQAKQTLEDARGIPNPGPRLLEQIARLEHMLVLAVSSVEVVFQSDGLTDVTLYRVAALGYFEQTSLLLKPGRYIAGGTRQGFRDVRIEFTITGEPLDAPIVVRCMEQI